MVLFLIIGLIMMIAFHGAVATIGLCLAILGAVTTAIQVGVLLAAYSKVRKGLKGRS